MVAPTEAELEILQVLWRKGACSVRQVWQELGQGTGYTTVLKTLQIMFDKKLVSRDESKMTHVYQASLSQADVQDDLVRSLTRRAFNGSAGQLVLRALEATPVSAEELDAIKRLLAQKKGKPK